MKPNRIILFLVALTVVCLSGCTSYKGVKIVYPQYEQVVSELQPTLQWAAVPGAGVTYDLIIFKENEINPAFFKKARSKSIASASAEAEGFPKHSMPICSNSLNLPA